MSDEFPVVGHTLTGAAKKWPATVARPHAPVQKSWTSRPLSETLEPPQYSCAGVSMLLNAKCRSPVIFLVMIGCAFSPVHGQLAPIDAKKKQQSTQLAEAHRLWAEAQRLDKEGKVDKAISAAQNSLAALRLTNGETQSEVLQ